MYHLQTLTNTYGLKWVYATTGYTQAQALCVAYIQINTNNFFKSKWNEMRLLEKYCTSI